MVEVFKVGELVYNINDMAKRKYTVVEYDGPFVHIKPVEPIMVKRTLFADTQGNPYLDERGHVKPKLIEEKDTGRILIFPTDLARFVETTEPTKG
jgi:hypothetical protein